MNIMIVGLGLIGGSIAKTLKKNSQHTVIGFDISSETLDDALKVGAIDIVWDGEALCDADITVLCMTPSVAVGFLGEKVTLLKKGSVVTDVCGVKDWVVENCGKICRDNGLYFVGGHPMAGKERSGFRNSDENLFNRASYILTPVSDTDPRAFEVVKAYVEDLRCAKLTVTDPKTHDRLIAFTSQLPHVIAGAYVKSPSCVDRKGFSAGSFKDVSRVATVDENLWTELFLKNKDMLLDELDGLIEHLTEYRTAIQSGDDVALRKTIKQGRIIKENDLNFTDERK
ncbi:MAG: prephenate dehydrogenase [Clostridia bacterium]|nr:prephenate dehydrogenase [Clostridia bacterium]